MVKPRQLSGPAESSDGHSSESIALTLHSADQSVAITHDGFSIGSSRQCDLCLNDESIRPLQGVIHLQAGAMWIESADDQTTLIINGRPCRRMALRSGDRIKLGATEFAVQVGQQQIELAAVEMAEMTSTPVAEDLSLLTAEELCDRIVSEQEIINELSERDQSGWEALLHAIESVGDAAEVEQLTSQDSTELNEMAAFETLLDELHQLNESIAERARELNEHEADVIASANLIEESQFKVAQRIDEILDQLTKTEPPTEFRASA